LLGTASRYNHFAPCENISLVRPCLLGKINSQFVFCWNPWHCFFLSE